MTELRDDLVLDHGMIALGMDLDEAIVKELEIEYFDQVLRVEAVNGNRLKLTSDKR